MLWNDYFVKNVFLRKREKYIEGKFKTGSLESPLIRNKIDCHVTPKGNHGPRILWLGCWMIYPGSHIEVMRPLDGQFSLSFTRGCVND